MATPANPQLIRLGRRIGEYVRQQSEGSLNIQSLQGVIADLTSESEVLHLQAPLRDLVSRQSFYRLKPACLRLARTAAERL